MFLTIVTAISLQNVAVIDLGSFFKDKAINFRGYFWGSTFRAGNEQLHNVQIPLCSDILF